MACRNGRSWSLEKFEAPLAGKSSNQAFLGVWQTAHRLPAGRQRVDWCPSCQLPCLVLLSPVLARSSTTAMKANIVVQKKFHRGGTKVAKMVSPNFSDNECIKRKCTSHDCRFLYQMKCRLIRKQVQFKYDTEAETLLVILANKD